MKLYLGLGVFVLLAGAAAFLGGRLVNSNVGNVRLGGPNEGQVSVSLDQITPAPELPTWRADITGSFVERKDNTLIVQAVAFGSGVAGVSGESPLDENSGVRVEVVVTAASLIYKDVTQFPDPMNGEIRNVQQSAAEGRLDELSSQSSLSVWGRRSGDRIIADVLFYMNPADIKK